MKSLKGFLLSLFLLFSTQCHSWWDEGHMLVSQIAYEHLSAEAKQEVDKIAQNFSSFYPDYSNFISLACWPDAIRSDERFSLFDTLHYTNFPYDSDAILSKEKYEEILALSKNRDIVWCLEKAKATLSNPKSQPLEKAIMLALLTHLIGDIHQPLHTTSRYSHNHPDGDMGGNLFMLQEMPVTNLHQLWDSGMGIFSHTRCPISDREKNQLETVAKEWIAKRKSQIETSFSLHFDPIAWAIESHLIATNFAFQIEENTKPNEEYLSRAKEISQQQITLAGYRLSYLLNELFTPCLEVK